MEFRQLEYFYKVSSLRNFTRAAEVLHIAQPSITNAIHKLEDELGLQLFDRSQKKVILTPEGQAFHLRAEKILYEVQQALSEMNDFKNLHKGTIKFAAPPMIGAYLFPNIFTHFKNTHPTLDLAVFEAGSLAARTMLEKEELDLGIIILPENNQSLNTIPITREQIMLCVSPEHAMSGAASIDFKSLRNESFIMLKEEFLHRQLIFEECAKHDFNPHIVFSSNQIETIKALVASNVGISFLMNMVVRKHPNIISIPLSKPIFITIGLAWKKDRYLSKASQAFIDFLTTYARRLPIEAVNSHDFKTK